jgi:hypothetical protein
MSISSGGSAVAFDDPNTFNGATSCTNAGCHGEQSATASKNVDQNEFDIWSRGPHSKSYQVLLTSQATRIARNMGLGLPTEASLCLDCHAANAPTSQHGEFFNIQEGVTCESCHGGSGQWLETHSTGDADRAQLAAQGMILTDDPIRRAEMCLDCHFGAKDQFAGHKLMGAGHPRVSFELDSYTEINAHHTVDDDYVERKNYIDGMRTVAIGQAMSIARRMELLADNQTGTIGFFPEFVFFDCHSCHAPMSVKRKASANRRGQPKLDDAHMQMLRVLMDVTDPGLSGQITADMQALHRAAGQSRGALIGAANRMRDTAMQSVQSLANRSFTGDDMRAILRTLADGASAGRYSDYASAEQSALVIDSTLAALVNDGFIDDAAYDRLSAALDSVFATVQDDNQFDARRFATAMRAFSAQIQ